MNFITGLSFLQSAVCVLACIGAYQGLVSVGELAIVSCIIAGTAIISATISDMGALLRYREKKNV